MLPKQDVRVVEVKNGETPSTPSSQQGRPRQLHNPSTPRRDPPAAVKQAQAVNPHNNNIISKKYIILFIICVGFWLNLKGAMPTRCRKTSASL